MMGLGGNRPDDDPLGKIITLFDDAGYIGVVATNCEQTYHRYLRPGEEVSVSAELTDVVGPKNTALGEGFFITRRSPGRSATGRRRNDVAHHEVQACRSGGCARVCGARDLDPAFMMRPAPSKDTQFFWDGVNAHELRLQKRPDGTLQHPPVPALWQDKTFQPTTPSPVARERCSASWCTTLRRCRGARCRSSSRSSNSRRAYACSVSCATSTIQGGDRNAGSGNVYRLSGR